MPPESEATETPKPRVSRAAKAVIAAAVPLALSLLMFAHTGELNEAEFSVALSGLLTALFVYLIPNTKD